MHTKNLTPTLVFQMLISLFVLTLGSSCEGKFTNQPTIQHNQQTNLQKFLEACNKKDEEKLMQLIVTPGSMKEFNANQVAQILHAAHINGLQTIYKMLIVALRRDCPAVLAQLIQDQNSIKKKEEPKNISNQQKATPKVQLPTDNYGRTPLYTACEQGHFEVVKQFLVHGVDANQPEDLMPLHIACEKGYGNIVQLLIEHGAKINQEDVDIARQNGHQSIVDLLNKYQEKQVTIN